MLYINESPHRESGSRKMKKKRRKRKNPQSRTAMLSITFVVSVLFIAMMANSASLEKKLDSYAAQSEKLEPVCGRE